MLLGLVSTPSSCPLPGDSQLANFHQILLQESASAIDISTTALRQLGSMGKRKGIRCERTRIYVLIGAARRAAGEFEAVLSSFDPGNPGES